MARLVSDITKVVFAFLASVIAARMLGPAGKGALSTLLYICTFLSYLAVAGLGDAMVLVVKGRNVDRHEVFSTSFWFVLSASCVCVGILWAMREIAGWGGITNALVAGSFLIVVMAISSLLSSFEYAVERISWVSLVAVIAAAITAALYPMLLIAFDSGFFGAVLATVIGSAVGLALMWGSAHKDELRLRFSFDKAYLTEALRFGSMSQAGYLLVALTERIDLVIVYTIVGERSAGPYSIALTLAQLVSYAPFAISMAIFPRMAELSDDEWVALLLRASRLITLMVLAAMIVVLPSSFVLVPTLFGQGFHEAIGQTMALAAGSLFWSQQWLLARAAASRGDAAVGFVSYLVGLATLTVSASLLSASFGAIGAAFGSSIAGLSGFLTILGLLLRKGILTVGLVAFIPRGQEMKDLAAFARSLMPFLSKTP